MRTHVGSSLSCSNAALSQKEIEGDRGQRKLAAEPKWKVDTPQGNIVRTPREKEKGLGRRGGIS